ncbi:MAG: glycolate oxidase subunit GlcD, partial [Desulfovibrionales bacterium]|nr:glycolate oxidase subunit GlcD [Desulfovibrionales bacterium]
KKEFHRVEEAVDQIFDVALSLKGTLSGEHGIGMAKSKWMEKETSRATIDYSLNMKRAIDPNNILNPGKIIAG